MLLQRPGLLGCGSRHLLQGDILDLEEFRLNDLFPGKPLKFPAPLLFPDLLKVFQKEAAVF